MSDIEQQSDKTIEELTEEQLQNHGHWFSFDLVSYTGYVLLVIILTSVISLNQKKFRKRYKVDNIYLFMILYLSNFAITWYFFNSLHKFFRIGFTSALFFIVSWFFNRFQIIGLTGGISMGKSQVAEYFEKRLKISVIDCDVLSRRVMEPGQPAYLKVVAEFGKQILQENSKEIDRKILGSIVFSHQKRRAWLTRTVGWYIFLEILKEIYIHCVQKKEQLVMLDAPLLFESKYLEYLCYPICCVYISDSQVQLDRLMKRDNISEEEAQKKINSQMSIHKKMKKSDILVCNDGTKEALIRDIGKQLPNFII